ncbi:MAG: hypothetical protein MJZ47_00275 [Bacteroidales bacterium]|nr:hypothetical protein [Bacteroidales bacterium]
MAISRNCKRFLSALIWLTLGVSAVSLPLAKYATVWWPLLVVLFFAVSLALYQICEKARKKDIHTFYNTYMISTLVKLIVYLAILLVYSLNFKEDSKRFMLTFLAYYLIYSVFETYQLVKKKDDRNGK